MPSLMVAAQRWKRQVTAVVVVAAVLVGVIGSLFFVVALSPVRLALEPGTHVRYQLTTEFFEPGSDVPLAVRQHTVHLICVDDGNDVAVVSEESDSERRGELTLMRFGEDGRARRYDPSLRLLDEGKALGFFDFNLLPLPQGLEQDWRVDLIYAFPPVGARREWTGRVRRVTNGFNPEFELSMPPMEWTGARDGSGRDDGWIRFGDLTCRYRYNGRHGVVDHAVLTFDLGMEVPDGALRREVRVTLDGRVEAGGEGVEVAALRDLAVASYGTQSALEDDRPARLDPLVARLREASEAGPEVLRELARELARDAELAVPDRSERGRPTWVVQVATVTAARREHAELVARGLSADGYRAWVHERGDLVSIYVGPYRSRDADLLDELRQRFPSERPLWREWR